MARKSSRAGIVKMILLMCFLLNFACGIEGATARKPQFPYIADAVGNMLPPPSDSSATVGSPVKLLTPDRYEFYTFDESGELVKRLMTMEEIQAIVAAGEESEGIATFTSNNEPTIAFNFSQPSHAKVHSVVTNVQNVLKSQMEAQKNKSHIRPTFDTPDVSDSWSQILPSIFGNTGVDIVPDKTSSSSFITPETETVDIDNNEYENSQSKESNEIPFISSTSVYDDINMIPLKTESKVSTSTTNKPISSTTVKPKSTTSKRLSTSTMKQFVTSTIKSTQTVPTTNRPLISSTSKKYYQTTTTKYTMQNKNHSEYSTTTAKPLSNSTTNKPNHFETISTYVPNTTPKYMTEKSTMKPNANIKPINQSVNVIKNTENKTLTFTTINPSVSKKDTEYEKINLTTITTQSVSPSTTVSSTEFLSLNKNQNNNAHKENKNKPNNNNNNDDQTPLPFFDVALSFSQIASDLGGNFAPVPPTSDNLLDTTKLSGLDVESKENLDIDIPPETTTESDLHLNESNSSDNFIQISTFDPHDKLSANTNIPKSTKADFEINTTTSSSIISTTVSSTTNIIDPVLSESMDDLLSQVVNEGPDPTSIVFTANSTPSDEYYGTTLRYTDEEVSQDTPNTEATTTQLYIDPISLSTVTNNSNLNKNKTDEAKIDENQVATSDNFTVLVTQNKTVETNIFLDDNKETNNNANNETLSTAAPVIIETTSNFILLVPDKINSSLSLLVNNTVNKYDVEKNKYHKQKNPEQLPKLDEFKKKIQKVNIDEKELANERNNSWKLIPSVSPPKTNEINKDKHKVEGFYTPDGNDYKDIVLEFPKENQGLEVTTKDLGDDLLQFTELCNELAFRYWHALIENIDQKRSIVFSPYSITSMLAMMFMGAKGATSGEMNEVLKLDDMVTFNPHFTLKNISDSIETTSSSGIAVSAFIRELYSERSKGKILTFYKERAQHFYNGHVEEINFKLISDIIRRRTNLLVKRYTWGKIAEYMKTNSITMNAPLAAFSANIFQTDCTGSSVEGRDGEMYFVVSPNVRQRRLVPVPAVVYRSNFLAGYDPSLDATAAALGNTNSIISTLFLMPGQQGNVVHANDLENLEKRLLSFNPATPAWTRLLRTLLPRVGLELQIPRFSHKSIFNVSSTLKTMGMKDLFSTEHADLGGMNGPSKDLYLSDMIQQTTFVTCGEGMIGEQHHIEEYPETLDLTPKRRNSRWITGWDEPRDYQRAFHDPHDVGDAMHLPLHLRPRQARLPTRNTQPARLKFDRPFLFFVRHNPTGMILYVGRYNPRLLP